MPPFQVEYYCPSQGEFWQRANGYPAIMSLQQAMGWAQVLKPGRGWARVVDGYGNVVYQI